jgi:hypothetical protein
MAQPTPPFDGNPETLANIVLFGSPESRRRLAEQVATTRDLSTLGLLAATVGSDEAWQLRARCFEVLGLAIGFADQEVAEKIMASVRPGGAAGGRAPQVPPSVPGHLGRTNLWT